MYVYYIRHVCIIHTWMHVWIHTWIHVHACSKLVHLMHLWWIHTATHQAQLICVRVTNESRMPHECLTNESQIDSFVANTSRMTINEHIKLHIKHDSFVYTSRMSHECQGWVTNESRFDLFLSLTRHKWRMNEYIELHMKCDSFVYTSRMSHEWVTNEPQVSYEWAASESRMRHEWVTSEPRMSCDLIHLIHLWWINRDSGARLTHTSPQMTHS